MEKKKRHKRRKDSHSKKKLALLIILILLLLILIGGGITVGHYMGLINHVGDIENVNPEDEFFDSEGFTGEDTMNPDDIKWDMSGPIGDDDLLNILLVGQDKREGQGRQRSDVMIVCSVNLETRQVSLISFMR